MEQKWYRFDVSCEKCGGNTSLVHFSYSADGELQFKYGCYACRFFFPFRIFASQLIHGALIKDLQQASNIVVPSKIPLKPPVKPPTDKLTDKDKKLLEDFGIDMEGK